MEKRKYMNPEVLEFSFQGLKGQFMGAFANFIQRILAKESIPNIKGFLTVNYPQMIELKSVDTVQGLIDFLSIYCSFDCFGLMVEIAVRFECLEAVEVLEKFEHERHRWYAYVLAVDFVRCHAEDEDAVTNNRVKVQFQLQQTKDKTTLSDFERFLSQEFKAFKMFIALYAVHASSVTAVHKSILTFKCTVPTWIGEKLVNHITTITSQLSSWSLKDVIVDGMSIWKPISPIESTEHVFDISNTEHVFDISNTGGSAADIPAIVHFLYPKLGSLAWSNSSRHGQIIKDPLKHSISGTDKKSDHMSGDSISIAYLSTTQVEPLQDTHENRGYYTTEATMERNPESSQLVLCESLSVQYKTSTCFDDAVQDQIISDLMEPTTLNPVKDMIITQDVLRGWILEGTVPVSVCLVALMGLPSSGKSEVLRKILRNAIQLKSHTVEDYMKPTTDPKGLSLYGLCAFGGEPHNQFAWSFMTKRYGAIFSILSHIIRQAVLRKTDIGNVKFEDDGSPLFGDNLLDEHLNWFKKKAEKHLKVIASQETKVGLLQGGITLANVMDIGVNKALYCLLPFILASCHKLVRLVFYSQDRDGPNMTKKAELKKEDYSRGQGCELLLQWRPRLSYLLQFATVGYQKKKRKEGITIMIPTTKQQNQSLEDSSTIPTDIEHETPNLHRKISSETDAPNLVKGTRDEIIKQAKSQNNDWVFHSPLTQFLPIDLDDNESIKSSKERLEKLVAGSEHLRFQLPLKWIFLRSIVVSIKKDDEPIVFVSKERVDQLAKKLNMSQENVKQFLNTFTDFGSILYIPISPILQDYVIVDILQFSSLLSKLFYPTSSESIAPSIGIITASEAKIILRSIHVTFMKIITSLGMVATINDTSRIDSDDNHLMPGEVCYFIPLARTTLPIIESLHRDDSAYIVIKSLNFPANIQACIAHAIMKRIPYASLVATKPCNITKFKFLPKKNGPAIELSIIYQDTNVELRLLNEDEAVDTTVGICTDVLGACCKALQKKTNHLKFNFGLWCKKKKTHHFIYSDYESDLCDECQKFYKENLCCKCWVQAVKKCQVVHHDEMYRLQKHKPLKPEEMLDVAKELAMKENQQKLTELAEKLEIPLDEWEELQKKYSGWHFTMSLLFSWQSTHSNEDHSKQTLSRILKELGCISIALRLSTPTIVY